MKKILLPLLALVISTGTFAAESQKTESPEEIVRKLYSNYTEPQDDNRTLVDFGDYASDELKALLAKDEQLAGGELFCIDYDFIIQGQDYDVEEIKRTLKIKTQDKDSVVVTFKNMMPMSTVVYKFDCTQGKCKITDLLEKHEGDAKASSFKEGLRQCLEKGEKEMNSDTQK